MDEKLLSIYEAFLVKTLNLTDGKELHQLVKTDEGELKENASELLLEVDIKRVNALKESGSGKTQESFDNGYKKGRKESLSELESDIKKTYEFDSNLQGVDLIRAVIDKNSKVGELTDDDIKKSKVHLDIVESLTTEKENAVKGWEEKYNNLEGSIKTKETFSNVSRRALGIIDGLNLDLSEDATKATKQKDVIINMLSSNNYEIQENRIVMLDADGKRREDAHGNLIPFESHVKELATSIYDVKADGNKSSAGNKKSDNKTPGNYSFKNQDDYIKQVKAAESLEKKAEITEAWRNQSSDS